MTGSMLGVEITSLTEIEIPSLYAWSEISSLIEDEIPSLQVLHILQRL
jgi:hypothetical protein